MISYPSVNPIVPGVDPYYHPEVEDTGVSPYVFREFALKDFMKEMSKPENMLNALTWRRLHLSRAKLKASSRTSALLSGFAMVAMVEVQLSHDIPKGLLIAFSFCTTLLVSVHMLALMISTCILPNLESVASVQGVATVSESPHEKLHIYIEIAWGFSTVFGLLLFMAEIAILCWVKFYSYSKNAAVAAMTLLIPVVLVFLGFAVHFYRKLVAHQYERSAHGLRELETMVTQLQNDESDISNTRPVITV
ncbi:calcium release-activated calcium channel protein 1-like [Tachypleus tridentatus]|uniref:calcium release-activated calcium channel protein 1-like n=1 Tax=Tachypleus tridentatus TaxID=6853 RepID=UPI003FD30510